MQYIPTSTWMEAYLSLVGKNLPPSGESVLLAQILRNRAENYGYPLVTPNDN